MSRHGLYCGALSGLPLFRGVDKYDSGTGWLSFSNPFDKDHIIKVVEQDGVPQSSYFDLCWLQTICDTVCGWSDCIQAELRSLMRRVALISGMYLRMDRHHHPAVVYAIASTRPPWNICRLTEENRVLFAA
jgi:hypothetical protein